MKTVMVRYKTAPAQAQANEALVRAVFDELRSRTPEGVQYASYRLEDGVTFVHVATLDSSEQNPLASLQSFKAFQAQLKERCDEQPMVTQLVLVDSYTAARRSS